MEQIGQTDKYQLKEPFSLIGKYSYSITIKDQATNEYTTPTKDFWITTDLNDTDSDGIPDRWERRYGLNPFDPSDANGDLDKDGKTNLEEYLQQTNPRSEPTFSQQLSLNIKNNAGYLAATIAFTLIIILIGLWIYRRLS